MHKTLISVTTASLFLAGCAGMSETQKNTATGAGVGAVAGALISAATGGHAGTGAAVGAGVGALGTYIWSSNLEKQRRDMQAATQGTGVGVTQTADNQLKLDIPSDISFAVGRSDISPAFAPVLDQFAAGLRSNPNAEVRIVGHTDSTGSDAINNPLSVDRANAARDYLVGRGVAAQRIATDGRGSREPVADNSSAQGRAKNRRVEIYVAEPAAR